MQDTLHPFDGDDLPKLSDDDKIGLVKQAVDEWMTFSQMIEQKRADSSENWQHYIENKPEDTGLREPNDIAGTHSNVRTGALASTLDGMHAQLCLAAFPSGTQFSDPKPRNMVAKKHKQDYERMCQEAAQKLNQLIYAYLDIKQLLLDGTSAVWHPWVRIEKKKAVYMAAGEIIDPNEDNFDNYDALIAGELTKTYNNVVQVEGTGFYPILFDDWRIDPTVDSLDKTPFLFRRWVYVEDLEENEAFEGLDEVVPYRDLLFSDSYKFEKLQYQGIEGDLQYNSHMMEDGDSKEAYPEGMVCLFERWGDFYVDGELYRNHVLIYSNDRTFHYFGPNPYDHGEKPFTVSPMIPIPGTLYGKTSITDAIPLMHTLDTMLNQGLDMFSASANAAFTYNPSDQALSEWIRANRGIRPGDLIPKQMQDSLTPLVSNLQNIQLLDSFMARVREMSRDTTGGVPYATGGVTSPDQRTLGEVEILASATNSRFQALLQTYERYRLQGFVLQEFENYRQYMSEPVEVSEDGKKLSPNVVKLMDMDFEITGSRTVLNKSKSMQDMRDALAMIPQIIQSGVAQLKPSGKTLNPMPIVEEMLATLGVSLEQVFEEPDMNAGLGGMNNGLEPLLQPNAGGPQGPMAGPSLPTGIPITPGQIPEGGQLPPEGY